MRNKKNAGYTPGPWTVQDEYDETLPIDGWDEDLDASVEIARVSLDMLTPKQREANARLIAAAPELLAALEAVMVAIDCYDSQHEASMARAINRSNPLSIEAARAAIAKAKGGA